MRRSATPNPPNARSMPRWNATRPTTSRTTSRRTSWTPTAARARAATGSAARCRNWSLGNNLIHHLWWHRALLRLDLGEVDAVMASYDQDIRNFDDPMTKATPDHYVDLQNAAALLWRLEQLGLDVGDRWEELADKAEARIGEAGHLLMVPHLMLALVATGRDAAAARFVAALRELAADPSLWTAPAIADVVIPVCEAAQAHRRGDHARVVDLLAPRQAQIRLLGGSNAQRDMFFQMLIDAADEGRPPRRGLGDDRARNRHPCRASHATRRIRRRRAVVAFLTLSGPPCSKPPPSGGACLPGADMSEEPGEDEPPPSRRG